MFNFIYCELLYNYRTNQLVTTSNIMIMTPPLTLHMVMMSRTSYGTGCAGEIGMDKNSRCGIGVAYKSTIASEYNKTIIVKLYQACNYHNQ